MEPGLRLRFVWPQSSCFFHYNASIRIPKETLQMDPSVSCLRDLRPGWGYCGILWLALIPHCSWRNHFNLVGLLSFPY